MMYRTVFAVTAAISALWLQPAGACESVNKVVDLTQLTTASLEIAPAAAGHASKLNLPPMESLTLASDFTVFMQPGVPKAVQASALRKLWRLDPAFGRSDGLDSDFVDAR